MTDDRDTKTSRRGFLGGAVSSAVGLFVGKARGAVSDGLPKIEMGDAGSDPSSNGVIARNGNRLKAYSAGRLIDFADALYPGEDFDGHGTSSFTDLQSLSTDDLGIDNIPASGTTEISDWRGPAGDNGEVGGQAITSTTGVSTSATTIHNLNPGGGERGGLVIVRGVGDNVNFTELVLVEAFGNAAAIGVGIRNSPAGRTYSMSGRELQLAMDSGTYDILTASIELFRAAP